MLPFKRKQLSVEAERLQDDGPVRTDAGEEKGKKGDWLVHRDGKMHLMSHEAFLAEYDAVTAPGSVMMAVSPDQIGSLAVTAPASPPVPAAPITPFARLEHGPNFVPQTISLDMLKHAGRLPPVTPPRAPVILPPPGVQVPAVPIAEPVPGQDRPLEAVVTPEASFDPNLIKPEASS